MIWLVFLVQTVIRASSVNDGADHRLLIENYLRGVAIALVAEIDNVQSPWALPGQDAMERGLIMRNLVIELVENVILSGAHLHELSQLANQLESLRKGSLDCDDEVGPLYCFFLIAVEMQSIPFSLMFGGRLEEAFPGRARLFEVARSVGMSRADIISAENHLFQTMDSDKSGFDMYSSLYNSGQVSEEEVEEADFRRTFTSLSKRIPGDSIAFIAKRIEIVEKLCDSRDKKLVLLRAFESILRAPSPISENYFNGAISRFARIVSNFPRSGFWVVKNSVKSQFYNHVISPFKKIIELQSPSSGTRAIEASLLDHRVAALIRRRFLSPSLAAIIDMIRLQGVSLVRLASFLEWVSTHDHTPALSSIIEMAFTMASRFGVRLLAEEHGAAVLLPGFSTETIIAVRKIIGSFIHFNGPSEWAEYSLSSVIARALQDSENIRLQKLNLSVKMLSFLRLRGGALLITPGLLVSEFLHRKGPTKYALIAHDVLMYHPLPASFADRFSDFKLILGAFIGFPHRFYRMEYRIGHISSIHRGNVPTRIMESAISLPRQVAKTELNLDTKLLPSVSLLVERSVFALFDLIEAVAENRFSSPEAASNRLALERCCTARANLQSQLYSADDEILVSSLLDSGESLISGITHISREIRSTGSFKLVSYC